MGLDEAIEAEAQAQAICMQTQGLPPRVRGVRGEAQAEVRGRLSERGPVPDKTYLDWPFFDDAHRALARELDAWCADRLAAGARSPATSTAPATTSSRCSASRAGSSTACRRRTAAGSSASTRAASACCAKRWRATTGSPTSRSRCRGSARARSRSPDRRRCASATCRGSRRAKRSPRSRCRSPTPAPTSPPCRRAPAQAGGEIVIDGTKTWISNGGIADFYTRVRARDRRARARRGISAFVVDADAPGPRRSPSASRSSRRTRSRGSSSRAAASRRRSASALPGEGFKVAMQTLDIFRASVAAAALGFARRALDEAIARATSRKMFGQTLADFQLTQAAIADMATGIDSSALLTYRAAWARDVKGERTTREAAMAKMVATETAQDGHRPRGADLRRPRRGVRPDGRAPVPRHPGVAHLRGRNRSAEAHNRAGNAEGLILEMAYTAHVDTFARDNLPPPDELPEFFFELPELRYPARMNCAAELLDRMVAAGHGDRPAIHTLIDGRKYSCTYRQLLVARQPDRARPRRDLKLVPGNRVLLRGPNNPMMAACWFGVIKAGCIAVATMPLLRAKELEVIVDKAHIGAALCDVRLKDELELARARCRDLKQVLYFNDGGAGSLEAALDGQAGGVRERRHRGRRRRAHRLHLGHDRAAEGLHALPSRRHGDVRRFPALVPEARRATTSSAARRRSRSRSASAGCSASRCASGPRPC